MAARRSSGSVRTVARHSGLLVRFEVPVRDAVASAASGHVCPVDDAAESFVVGVVVAPDDVAADHAGLLLVGCMVGAVEREVAQRGELGSLRFHQEAFVGVYAISTLFAAAHSPTRLSLRVVRWGEKLSQMIAIGTCGG